MAYPLFHPRNRSPAPDTLTMDEFAEVFEGEGAHLEFREGFSRKAIAESVVAFSNTGGGVILVGVDSQGRVKGAPRGGRREAELHGWLGHIHDPGRYEIHTLMVDNRSVMVIAVANRIEGYAQTSDGRLLVRRGASNQALMGPDLARFVTSRALRRFETSTTAASLEQADPDLLAELADAWSWSGTGVPDRLEEHGFVERTGEAVKLTVAGVLYLMREPHKILGKTYIEIFRYRDEGSVEDRRVEVTGPLPAQVREAAALVMDELGYDLVVVGMTRYELPRLPEIALREAIANAVAHRSYEAAGASVRVEIRPDRVVVRSPGGLPEPVTISNIREQNAARNIGVIKTLRRYRLAEDAGRGVDAIQDELASDLRDPPEFSEDGSSVRVVLPLTGPVSPEERVWIREVERDHPLQHRDRLLLIAAFQGETLTNARAREILGVDSRLARQALQKLRNRGLVRQQGERGGAEYRILPHLRTLSGPGRPRREGPSPSSTAGPGLPIGRTISDEEVDSIVMDLASKGPVTNALVRRQTGLDRIKALAVLAHLVDTGRLERRGERRGTHYVRRDSS